MTRKYNKYDNDFKLEAAKLVTKHGYSYVQAARQLGLKDWAVRGWVMCRVLKVNAGGYYAWKRGSTIPKR